MNSIIQEYQLCGEGDYKLLDENVNHRKQPTLNAAKNRLHFSYTKPDQVVLFRDKVMYETVSMYFYMLKDEMKKESVSYAS
tara:strand:- start:42 stop:284 length:243 start_codon:yes stop_codon:yes gene_type:complete